MTQTDKQTKALQLISRFTLPPNSLGYCGKGTAPEKFKKCVIECDCHGVKQEVGKFIVLNPYIKTISKLSGLPTFDYDVIESYWLGNKTLNKAKPEHYELLMKNFEKQGVPSWFVEELRLKPPKKFIPTHLFQVLHIGVGKASGAVPFNLTSINNCMIRWGVVEKIIGSNLTVKLNSLKSKGGNSYSLTYIKEAVPFIPEFLPGLKVGSVIAVHWKQAIKLLTPSETKKIEFWTNEILKSL